MTDLEIIRRMFASLASAHAGLDAGEAFATVRDAIDMGTLAPEFMTRVVLGKTSLADALRDAADVTDEAGIELAMADETDGVAADLRAAADILDTFADL